MGSSTGGGTTTTSQANTSAPWAGQQPYLSSLFGAAQTNEQAQTAAGPFTGSFYSPDNDTQGAAATNAAVFSSNNGQDLGTAQTAASENLLNGANSAGFSNNAHVLSGAVNDGSQTAGVMGNLAGFGSGANTTQGATAPLSNALNTAAVSGANNLGTYSGQLNDLAAQSASDPTARLSGDASTYASTPYVQNAINSTNAQINQTLNEQTVPGLNRQASMGGNLNSSRAGMAEAMANEGAGIAEGNADASIENNAYNSGLSTAGSQYTAGQNSAINANAINANDASGLASTVTGQQTALNEFNTSSQLNGANSYLGDALSGNSQLGNTTSLGVNAATGAETNAATNFSLGEGAGGVGQTDQNAQLANAYQQWQQANGYESGVLGTYGQLIGGNYGTTSTASGSQTAPTNVAGTVAGLGLTAAALYKAYSGS